MSNYDKMSFIELIIKKSEHTDYQAMCNTIE